MTERVIRHATIRGRVQGVGYRDWTRYVARERGVEGWVRNREEGSVEAVFSGMRGRRGCFWRAAEGRRTA